MKKLAKFFGITFGLTLLLTGIIGYTPSNTLQAEHGKTFLEQSSDSQYVLREHGKTF
ncbi:hypothetical protein [Bacillus cereus group sp. BfR-BA-01380]|uniref:hypothetical protein n=1 Tax=Bacillus cereus group sp. BfR-BA-01380 TaxID=2920324 RepID=UPI001F57D470|nr:hypothetical protein [Bacillus cereus group sp. BfR-BA-01380]